MKHLFLLLTFLVNSLFCLGQGRDSTYSRSYPNNSIFIEIGGNSVFFGSLNYERTFLKKDFFYLSGRIGVGYGNFVGSEILSTPILINGIFQIYHALAFEIVAGLSLMSFGTEAELGGGIWSFEYEPAPTGIAGIRIQAKNGFLFRLDFTPLYAHIIRDDHGYHGVPWFGFSLGYSFGKKKTR